MSFVPTKSWLVSRGLEKSDMLKWPGREWRLPGQVNPYPYVFFYRYFNDPDQFRFNIWWDEDTVELVTQADGYTEERLVRFMERAGLANLKDFEFEVTI